MMNLILFLTLFVGLCQAEQGCNTVKCKAELKDLQDWWLKEYKPLVRGLPSVTDVEPLFKATPPVNLPSHIRHADLITIIDHQTPSHFTDESVVGEIGAILKLSLDGQKWRDVTKVITGFGPIGLFELRLLRQYDQSLLRLKDNVDDLQKLLNEVVGLLQRSGDKPPEAKQWLGRATTAFDLAKKRARADGKLGPGFTICGGGDITANISLSELHLELGKCKLTISPEEKRLTDWPKKEYFTQLGVFKFDPKTQNDQPPKETITLSDAYDLVEKIIMEDNDLFRSFFGRDNGLPVSGVLLPPDSSDRKQFKYHDLRRRSAKCGPYTFWWDEVIRLDRAAREDECAQEAMKKYEESKAENIKEAKECGLKLASTVASFEKENPESTVIDTGIILLGGCGYSADAVKDLKTALELGKNVKAVGEAVAEVIDYPKYIAKVAKEGAKSIGKGAAAAWGPIGAGLHGILGIAGAFVEGDPKAELILASLELAVNIIDFVVAIASGNFLTALGAAISIILNIFTIIDKCNEKNKRKCP